MRGEPCILIVPGLRDAVAQHWQSLLEARLRAAGRAVAAVHPMGREDLDCATRVAAIEREAQAVRGPLIVVAHSGGCIMLARWARQTKRTVAGALLAAPPDFDARFSAVKRHYLYRIANRRADLALERQRAWRIARPLDAEAMHRAAQRLVGRHDFTTFRAAECQARSPVKTLGRLDVDRRGEDIEIHASARSFLHHQVRSMVGSLALVGDSKWTADDLAGALAAKDRAACGPVAPPDGLYLVRVDY